MKYCLFFGKIISLFFFRFWPGNKIKNTLQDKAVKETVDDESDSKLKRNPGPCFKHYMHREPHNIKKIGNGMPEHTVADTAFVNSHRLNIRFVGYRSQDNGADNEKDRIKTLHNNLFISDNT